MGSRGRREQGPVKWRDSCVRKSPDTCKVEKLDETHAPAAPDLTKTDSVKGACMIVPELDIGRCVKERRFFHAVGCMILSLSYLWADARLQAAERVVYTWMLHKRHMMQAFQEIQNA